MSVTISEVPQYPPPAEQLGGRIGSPSAAVG